jgi:hypothetical protein
MPKLVTVFLMMFVVAPIAVCGTVALLWAAGGTRQPLEATVQMEQLAAKVGHASSIYPDTAREIAQVLALPQYDCDQVACSTALQARNSAARGRLKTLIATITHSNSFAASSTEQDRRAQ